MRWLARLIRLERHGDDGADDDRLAAAWALELARRRVRGVDETTRRAADAATRASRSSREVHQALQAHREAT